MGLVSHWVSWQLGGTHLRPCSVGRVFSRSTWPRAGRWVLHVLVVVVRCRCLRASLLLSFVLSLSFVAVVVDAACVFVSVSGFFLVPRSAWLTASICEGGSWRGCWRGYGARQ